MLCPAVWTLKPYQLGPDAREGSVLCINLEINGLLGVRAPTNEVGHRVAPKPKNEMRLPASHLAADSPRAECGPINCGLLERRLDGRVVAFCYPRAFEVAD
jgi:hypothetical protein